MLQKTHYKQGYKIVIRDCFYEVIDGKKVVFYGEFRHVPTPQEVWNKTVAPTLILEYARQKSTNVFRVYK